MKYNLILIPVLLFALLACACTTESEQVPERYAPIYDKNKDAPLYKIEIPEAGITDLPYDAVQAIQLPEGVSYAAGLGIRVVATPDSLFVVTADRKTIKSIDIDTGKLLNEYSFLGHGPGEYQYINNLQVTDEAMIIADLLLAKVNIYDRSWNLTDEILLPDMEPASVDSDIFYMNSSIYYQSATDTAHVIGTVNLMDRSDTTVSFHKRVIPLGWHPRQYNSVMMDASPSGELLVANNVSPFLFLYQKRALKELYYLDLPGLELLDEIESNPRLSERAGISGTTRLSIEHPPPVPIDPGERGVRMYPFLVDIIHTNDHIVLYYSNWHAKQRFLTVLSKDINNRWQHGGSYRFLKASGELYHVANLSYSEPWLYLSSNFEDEILRVNIKELIQR